MDDLKLPTPSVGTNDLCCWKAIKQRITKLSVSQVKTTTKQITAQEIKIMLASYRTGKVSSKLDVNSEVLHCYMDEHVGETFFALAPRAGAIV